MTDADLRPIQALVEQIADLEKRVAKTERAGRLSNAAIDAGSLTMKDENGNAVAVWDTTSGGLSVTYPTGPTPPTPSAPAVVGTPGALTVQWDGTYQDQAASPGDLAAVQVYAAPSTGLESDDPDDPVDPDLIDDDWTPDLDTLVGTIHTADGGTVTAVVDPGDYDVHLVAVALSGASSEPTTAAPVTVPSLAEDPELDAALTELDEQLTSAAEDLARVSGLYTTSTSAPTVADGAGKPDGAWWVQIDATGAQVGTWAWNQATGAWTATPLTPQQIPAVDVGKLVASSATVDTAVINKIWAGILTVRDLIADAINGKTITGATINGGTMNANWYYLLGKNDGIGFDIRIGQADDGRSATIEFSVPSGVSNGTIRAFDNDPFIGSGNSALVLRPPARSAGAHRPALRLIAAPSGSLGTIDVGGHFSVQGDVTARNASGGATSISINNLDTDNGGGNSASIQSLGIYSKRTSGAANVYVSASGYLYRYTSLRSEKLDIEDLPADQIEAILNVEPKWWFDRGESERLAEYMRLRDEDPDAAEEYAQNEDVPANLRRIPGVIAEEVEDAGAEAFLTRDYERNLTGVSYERIAAALLPVVKQQREQITALSERVAALEESRSS